MHNQILSVQIYTHHQSKNLKVMYLSLSLALRLEKNCLFEKKKTFQKLRQALIDNGQEFVVDQYLSQRKSSGYLVRTIMILLKI